MHIRTFNNECADPSLPSVALNVKEGRQYLSEKSHAAWKYVYEHHLNDSDWFLKADDDTYVVMENLRYMLLKHDNLKPVYFGCRFHDFMSGGAGYVLSREAVTRLVEKALPNPKSCPLRGEAEDVSIGLILFPFSLHQVEQEPFRIMIPQESGTHAVAYMGSQPVLPNWDAEKLPTERMRKVRVLCWIMTMPGNHEKAMHVKKTWGKRCDQLIFMSSRHDPLLPTVALDVKEGRDHLSDKSHAAWKYVYQHHLNDSDWFLKADDDTYVVMENLRFMLHKHDPLRPVYFGCRFHGFMSGGAGYVLSREALNRLAEEALPNPKTCPLGKDEDVSIGKCLTAVGVEAGDSRDEFGRWRFFPFNPETHLNPIAEHRFNWLFRFTHYNYTEGPECCSDTAIAFHYVSPNLMHAMEYLIYRIHPYGVCSIEKPDNALS
ncbi:unnamed protein product [Darwinula stevensoni]|uniref:Glycoprotein-N-acetylgalactosamine 3-beta-galactosyltransferase 1 n=1 Tax=Darwinula stevensoni TaxID=69355 RepID=A0A7R9A6V3_9CRUS|nr:unnamed protein product [Darwinula stevensoni]CAG0890465.1 unnamed protein product [Darwinula stevensoni]